MIKVFLGGFEIFDFGNFFGLENWIFGGYSKHSEDS